MPACAVCSSPASSQCSRCKSVSYCTPAHQREDWPAHKIQCPRLSQAALATVFQPCDQELLLRITTCLAQNGYHKEVGVMVQVNKAFWNDEQIWDAYKDVPGAGGRTRLMYACFKKLTSRVKWLLARGAKVNTASAPSRYTALMGASIMGHLDIINVLFANGANPNLPLKDGFTLLMGACSKGHREVVRVLCERGADVNAARSGDGATAAMLASQSGYLEIVRLLADQGANVNAARTDDGMSALMLASARGRLGLVRELCARGASVNAAQFTDATTALMWASQEGHLEIVRELCDAGANVNAARPTDGITPLMWATRGGHLEVVRELCERGGNVNAARTTDGVTVLMFAGGGGNVALLRYLIEKGANKAATNKGGTTAFDLARNPAAKAALKL